MPKIQNIHPGEILLEEFLIPMKLSQTKLAKSIGVSPRRINEIVLRKRAITPGTALRLAQFFGTSPEFWVNLQTHYDLIKEAKDIKSTLKKIIPYRAA